MTCQVQLLTGSIVGMNRPLLLCANVQEKIEQRQACSFKILATVC
jgi:hypothetical protein